jgi:hypothetical protein
LENLVLSASNDLIFYTGGTTPSAVGTERLRIYNSDGRADFAGVLSLPDGSAGAPAISNTGDANTGMYWPGDHQVGFTVNNSRKFYIAETKAYFQNLSSGVEINAGGIDVTGDSTFAGQVNITSSGAAHFGITNTNVSGSSQQYLQYVGSNGDYVFRNATDSTTPLFLAKNNNATFAGDINLAAGKKLQYSANSFMTPENNVSGAEISTAGTFIVKTGTTPTLALTLNASQNATFSAKAYGVAPITSDPDSTIATKGYVQSLITGATIYRGTWDPDVSLNSGYGNPNLNTVTQTSGYYYICSADGAATPNGATTEPNTWNTGDWVIWNDDIGTSGEWQKIDNSSVLSGVGTGQTVALWQGPNTVTDSETLGNSIIRQNNSNIIIGSTTTASNVALNVLSNDSHNAEINAYGNSQGTGVHYVGQSADYGGGIAYNGDGSPSYGNFGTDRVTLFRRENGTSTKVIDWSYGNSNPRFYGSASFENGVAFSSAASIRQQSDILILTGGGNGFAFNDDTNAVSNLLITAGGEATFSSTVKASTYLVNLTSAAGIGASLGDINGSELGPGYLTVSRDDTANAKQISFYKNNVEHSYLETTTSGLNIGGANVGIGTSSPGYKLDVAEKIRMVGGLKITPTTSSLYAEDGALSYYGSTNGVYLNGAGANGWLRLQASGVENDQNSINIYGSASAYMTFRTANSTRMIINSAGNVGIGTTSPGYKLDVNGGIQAGGVVTYSKAYGSLNTTGNAVAGLTTSTNGQSAGFTFTCFGHSGGYQKIVYSCYNGGGNWYASKVIDEGTNQLDVVASANSTTITFTFKSISGTMSYTPRVTVEAVGTAINSTYA